MKRSTIWVALGARCVKSVPEHCSGILAENHLTLIFPYPVGKMARLRNSDVPGQTGGVLKLHVWLMFTEASLDSLFGLQRSDCVPWKKWERHPSRTPGRSWGNPVVCHPRNTRRSPEHWAGWTVAPVLEMSPGIGSTVFLWAQIRFLVSQGKDGQPS